MAAMFYFANFGTACYAQTAQSTAVRNFPAADRGKVRPMERMSTRSSTLADRSSVHQLQYRTLPCINVVSKLRGFSSCTPWYLTGTGLIQFGIRCIVVSAAPRNVGEI